MTWNDSPGPGPMVRQLCALSAEEKQRVLADLCQSSGDMMRKEIIEALFKCDSGHREKLRELIGGCRCDGGCKTRPGRCVGRRLSQLEEAQLTANIGGTVDIPTVAGAGGTVTVTVPPYGTEYFISEFSVDGAIAVATGALSKVQIQIKHAGTVLADFRASQFFKNSCCTTIADQFKRMALCFGYESKWEVVVVNNNTNAGEAFVNGVLSFARAFPLE